MIGRLSSPQVSDRDPLVAMAIDCVHLAVRDYLSGPGSGVGADAARRRQDYESARAFLARTGLLKCVHERLGAPEHGDVAQLSFF
jgi:hypothetical protein